MKKIDSNSYAWKWILTGLAPLAMAGILAAAQGILGLSIPVALINALSLTGASVLFGFGLFLAVELVQDRRLDAHYQKVGAQSCRFAPVCMNANPVGANRLEKTIVSVAHVALPSSESILFDGIERKLRESWKESMGEWDHHDRVICRTPLPSAKCPLAEREAHGGA